MRKFYKRLEFGGTKAGRETLLRGVYRNFWESKHKGLQEYSYDELKKFTQDFSTKLGSGGFGDVYKGHFPDGEPIAVKVLKGSLMDLYLRELSAHAENTYGDDDRNRYIIKCFGYCYGDKKAVIFEYMENGSLSDAIKNPCIKWMEFYHVVLDLGRAISYLHFGSEDEIIHNDIKPANVLLDSHLRPKLSDFGLANFHESGVGTRGYIAPEISLGMQPSSAKSDVFSFGMVLFDIAGSKRNCADKKWFPGQVWEHFKRKELDKIIIDCGIQERDRKHAKILFTVALLCAEHNPQNRPDMNKVVLMLEGEIVPPTPVNPFPYYDSSSDQSSTIGGSTYNYPMV